MPGHETRFAVLLFTDIVDSTGLKARHGVPAYSEAFRTHNGHFERIARACPGIRILQNTGDGYFAEAGGVAEAVRFALLFQEALREGQWSDVVIAARVGIHAGEIEVVDSESGSGVVAPAADLAARVMSLAGAGQILLTRFPFDEARHFIREHPAVAGKTMPPLGWLAHGPYLMKGRDDPLEVFEVGAEGLAPLSAPPDSDKVKRAIRPGEEETLGWRPAVGLEIPGRTGWHLTERLGAGGFGEVWTGEHGTLHERRAFKFCFDDERLRALKREVTLFRLLRSALGERDDIVRIHELKLDEPPFYLESDLAPHGNLLQWAERQGGLDKIPLTQRIALVAHTATALAAAHSVGVLHKDIKPTNILIFDGPGGEPRPRLVDFGIGALADQDVLAQKGITAAGFTRVTIQHSTGTPTYSPPEYLAGKPYTIQGDIYGLGVLLHQLATARPLDPLASGWERDIPDPLLREDIATCVDGEPARRFQSAAALATRLLALPDRHADIRRAEEAAAATARQAASRERMQNFVLMLGLPALTAAIISWISDERELLIFVACAETLWFGCINIFLGSFSSTTGKAILPRDPGETFRKFLRVFLLTTGQTLLFYGVVVFLKGGVDGSLLLQLSGLLGLAWSTAGLALMGLALTQSQSGLFAFLSTMVLLQLFTSGYVVKPQGMTNSARAVSSFTPGYSAQVVMDMGFIYNRRLVGEIAEDHYQSIKNLGANDIRNRTADDRFTDLRSTYRALITEFVWGVAGCGVSIWLFRRRAKR